MTPRSLAELRSTAHKAAVGAGFAVGLAEDAAAATSWLCEHGFAGAQALLHALETTPSVPACEWRDAQVVFARASAVCAGPSAIDLALTTAGLNVVLESLDAPLLVAGLAGAASEARASAFRLEYAAGQLGVDARGLSVVGELPTAGADVCIKPLSLGGEALAATARPARVDIADDVWQALNTLAARTYVPASDASRARGAGAAVSDND